MGRGTGHAGEDILCKTNRHAMCKTMSRFIEAIAPIPEYHQSRTDSATARHHHLDFLLQNVASAS